MPSRARLLAGPGPAFHALREGRYLTALEALSGSRADPSLRARALNAVDPWDTAWQSSGGGAAFDLDGHPAPPLDDERLATAIRGHRVVILMESHRAPETARLGTRLLHSLRAAGATHLAFETYLQDPLDRFQSSGCLLPDTAAYAFDPSQAALLRTARVLGLHLVAFDITAFSLFSFARVMVRGGYREIDRRREESMAQNIVRLLELDPAARVVVWTGEQHAWKRNPTVWTHPFMAQHLARLLDEEPFCVGQHVVQMEGPPTLRLLAGNHPWAAERGLDAVVLHHRSAAPMCPPWLEETLLTMEVEPDGATLVQAIPEEVCAGPVPADQRLTHGRAQRLLVERGRYLVRGIGPGDQELWRRPVTV